MLRMCYKPCRKPMVELASSGYHLGRHECVDWMHARNVITTTRWLRIVEFRAYADIFRGWCEHNCPATPSFPPSFWELGGLVAWRGRMRGVHRFVTRLSRKPDGDLGGLRRADT